MTFSAAAPPAPAVFYYYLTGDWTTPAGVVTQATPAAGAAAPFVFFVSRDHLADLDLHGDLADVFDLIRMMRHLAWHEPMPFADRLASVGIGDDRVDALVNLLERRFQPAPGVGVSPDFRFDEREAALTFADGSRLAVPRRWRGRITDVTVSGPLASALMWSTEPIDPLRLAHAWAPAPAPRQTDECRAFDRTAVNAAFYRHEPHLLNRYLALAFDNIERAPLQFAAASAYRAVRLFVIRGTDDRLTSQQFSHGGAVYAAATVASGLMATLLVCGVVIAWRRGEAIGLPLLLILYVPLTIAPMLTNMRYTVTVQPIGFMFVAATVIALLEHAGLLPPRHPTRGPAETQTAHRP